MPNTRPEDYEIGLLLRQAHRKAAATFSTALEPLGIQGRHFGVLLVLHRASPLTQRQLIEQLGSDKSSMVRTIDELEARGLCRRRHSDSDRRANDIHLTEDGQRMLADADESARQTAKALLAGLTTEQQDQLQDLLRRLIATAP